ncbi:unnamed protein product [Rotaria sordida]|uniref:Uncharacterized protein n=1 Tax=Rotaria sordida TaxID=392033 RepID=A0A818JI78_9BILA|nr:unnamed protein product [Rotaria sordida]CAF1173431.1 unnamed protein product [Rotaria sordida]CAF3538933.1 unnamed protein product [Rotaria sordida]CAF3546760.1 unnamed protein product [Rotaria sordida]
MNDLDSNETSLLIPRPGVPYDEPDNRQSYQRKLATYAILASTALERLAFYSLVINLVITLQLSELDWDPANSVTASFIFLGTSYISTLVFAVLSDAKLGRARTIIIGFFLYLIGYIIVSLIANTTTHTSICRNSSKSNETNISSILNEHCVGPIIGTLIFTAIGVGATQANMAVFGAEQVQESNKPSRYFDKYIIAVNIGGIFATVVIPYIQVTQNDPNRFFHGYLVSGLLLIGALLLFILSYRFYIHIEPYDTIITKCIPVVINAFQTWRKHSVDNRVTNNIRRLSSSSSFLEESITDREDRLIRADENLHSFLDFARASHNGRFIDRIVDDVKSLRRIIIVFLLLIPYWLVYYQVQTTFFLQGEHMNIPYISNVTQIKMPVIWMSVGDQVSIIIGILILNLFVYKHLVTYNQSTLIQIKFVVGMILASITMFIAGTIEKFRQHGCHPGKNNSDLSIFTQLPQYIGIGLSEVFGMVASFEFAYLAAPRSAQSLTMSLRFCSLGLSSFISDVYVKLMTITSKKFDFDCQNTEEILYIYFYVLGGVQLLTIFVFILCHRKFRILQLNPYQINKKQFI